MACPCARALACETSADYSVVPGDRILPFLFGLDEENSRLTPAAGENQRFCYNIAAKGHDSAGYADLSHFVLGICDTITADELANITVERDGVSQEVVFGENVELKTVQAPDPTTGCPGLKFNFSLNKVSGTMRVCFELLKTYPVGPVRVCVKGGQQTQNGLFICGPVCEAVQNDCGTSVYQRLSVCVPVTVTPFAYAGEVTTACCGDPVVTAGTDVCEGRTGGSCSFTVSRTLCLTIPIVFGAQAETGEPGTNCLGASVTETCAGCDAT